jgi:YidC/Oxa1 family membrane protein insertase
VEFFDTILWPIRWVIEAVLSGSHAILEAMGMDPASGSAWFLSIMVLVLLVRAALIPVFVRQIKSQRRMMEIAPELKKIQDKYKGKKDQFSREAMSRETMALYSKAGTNPFSSCLPLLTSDANFLWPFPGAPNSRGGSRWCVLYDGGAR